MLVVYRFAPPLGAFVLPAQVHLMDEPQSVCRYGCALRALQCGDMRQLQTFL